MLYYIITPNNFNNLGYWNNFLYTNINNIWEFMTIKFFLILVNHKNLENWSN